MWTKSSDPVCTTGKVSKDFDAAHLEARCNMQHWVLGHGAQDLTGIVVRSTLNSAWWRFSVKTPLHRPNILSPKLLPSEALGASEPFCIFWMLSHPRPRNPPQLRRGDIEQLFHRLRACHTTQVGAGPSGKHISFRRFVCCVCCIRCCWCRCLCA